MVSSFVEPVIVDLDAGGNLSGFSYRDPLRSCLSRSQRAAPCSRRHAAHPRCRRRGRCRCCRCRRCHHSCIRCRPASVHRYAGGASPASCLACCFLACRWSCLFLARVPAATRAWASTAKQRDAGRDEVRERCAEAAAEVRGAGNASAAGCRHGECVLLPL